MNTLKDYVNFRLTHADKVSEAQGCPLELYDCKKYKPMKDFKIYGESVQDGIPTPQIPIEVQCVGDLSVNLLADARDIYNGGGSAKANSYAEVTEDGRECIRFTSAVGIVYDKIKFKENTQYTFSFDCKDFVHDTTYNGTYDVPFGIWYTDGSKSYTSIPINSDWTKITITSGAKKTISYIGMASITYRTTMFIDINTFQIEEGAVATPYQPYYDKYKIPLIIKGKNILEDARDIYNGRGSAKAHNYAEVTEDGRECIRFTSAVGIVYDKIKFKENTQYTFSFDCKDFVHDTTYNGTYDVPFGIWYTDGSKSYTSIPINSDWTKITITSGAKKTISYIGMASITYRTTMFIDINTFQIEEGAVATEYEPYFKQSINIFLEEPLRRIGDCADYIDFKAKKVIRNVDRILVKYDNNYGWWTINKNTQDVLSLYRQGMSNYHLDFGSYSSYFPHDAWNNVNVNQVWNYYGTSAGFAISTDLIDGYDHSWTNEKKREAFLQWAESIGLDWYLARKTPREEALNIDIPKIKCKTTIIEVGTSLAPGSVFGKYIKK